MTTEDLIAFEQEIAQEFNAGHIRAPIHLDGGNEAQLIEIFKEVQAQDWVCCTWRSHYKCLLKGVPLAELKTAIITGKSITLCFPEYRVISSAIVGGVLPIALGLAWSIKRNGGKERVWAFVGDMTARGGMFVECCDYAMGHQLPIKFIIEDNGKSVCTPTEAAWGGIWYGVVSGGRVQEFKYDLPWPHSGAGKRVEF